MNQQAEEHKPHTFQFIFTAAILTSWCPFLLWCPFPIWSQLLFCSPQTSGISPNSLFFRCSTTDFYAGTIFFQKSPFSPLFSLFFCSEYQLDMNCVWIVFEIFFSSAFLLFFSWVLRTPFLFRSRDVERWEVAVASPFAQSAESLLPSINPCRCSQPSLMHFLLLLDR